MILLESTYLMFGYEIFYNMLLTGSENIVSESVIRAPQEGHSRLATRFDRCVLDLKSSLQTQLILTRRGP